MLLAPILYFADSIGLTSEALSSSAPVASVNSQPRGLPYTYLQAAYVSSSVDGFDDDPDGVQLDLSYALGESWFAFAGFSRLDGSTSLGDVDADAWHAGLGIHTDVAPRTDLVLAARWIESDVDASGAATNADDEGYGLEALLRFDLDPHFELDAGLLYVDLDDAGSDTAVEIGATWYLLPQLGLTGAFTSSDDADTFLVGVRLLP